MMDFEALLYQNIQINIFLHSVEVTVNFLTNYSLMGS